VTDEHGSDFSTVLVIPSPLRVNSARDLLLRDRVFYVYLLASRSRVLYTGITNNLGETGTDEHGSDFSHSPVVLTGRSRSLAAARDDSAPLGMTVLRSG
jgi:hypothetical protein